MSNTASGYASMIGGGDSNTASGWYSAVAGGFDNTASGASSLAGGYGSEARGDASIALGRRAKTYSGANNGVGAIVFADSNDFDFNISTDNRFAVRATGGVYLVLAIDAGGLATSACVVTSSTGGWNCISDRNVKHGLVALDGREVLDKLAAMPIYQWQPKGANAHVRHYGPMAQDFHAAFGLGDSDTMIGTQDADGVALAAIQGLHAMLKERDTLLARQSSEIRDLKAELAALRDLVEHILHGAIVPAVQR